MPSASRTKRPQEIRLHLVTKEDDRHSFRCEFVKPAKSLEAVNARGRVMDALRAPLHVLNRDSVGASLIGAGMISVLVYPFIATRLAALYADEDAPAETVEALEY